MEKFIKTLKAHDMRATKQRLAVHRSMLKLGHASADMVSDDIKARGDTPVTVASVYNILSQLALLGIYKHRMSANNKMYFDINTSRHIHLYDVYNHTYRDIVDDELRAMVEEKLKRKRFKGYKIDGVDIQILCHPSRRKSPLSF